MIVWPLLSFLGLILGAQSQECEAPYGRLFNVTDQTYIDALSSSCTTMLGTLMIANNFTGSFVLPNITNITGGIMLDWWDFKPTPPVTVLDLPDLQYLESSIEIMSLMDTLERISLPKLEYLRSMTLIQYPDDAELDLSGLKKLDRLYVQGNYSKVGFDSLQNVTEKLTICNTIPCGIYMDDVEVEAPRHAMEVALPNLEVAHELGIYGDVSDLIAPKLSSADLTVHSLNSSVRLAFPHLRYVNYALNLQGHIMELSLPRLEDVVGNLIIKSSYPLNVSVPVAKSHYVGLSGKIEDVVLPNLGNFSLLEIETELPLDCDKVLNRINQTAVDHGSDPLLGCDSPYEKPGGLSTKVKIIIGVVVGIVGVGVILGGIFFWRKKQASKRTKAIGMSASAVELTTFGAGQRREGQGQGQAEAQHEPPPPYTADRS